MAKRYPAADTGVRMGFNRRDFLRASVAVPAAAGAGYFAFRRLEGGPVPAVLVGAGQHGREGLVAQSPPTHVRFVGYTDPRPSQARAAREAFFDLYGEDGRAVAAFPDFAAVLADPKVQAVVIATPTDTHAALAVEALKAGKHVYCEAPMAATVADCKKMAQIAQGTGKVLAVGHQRAGNSRYAEAVENLRSGWLGSVKYMEFVHHLNRLTDDPWKPLVPAEDKGTKLPAGYGSADALVHWRLAENRGGGLIGEVLGRQLDALRLFLDNRMPLAVVASGMRTLPGAEDAGAGAPKPPEDHVYCQFECPDNVICTFAGISTSGLLGYGETLMGTHGTLVFRNEQELELVKEDRPPLPSRPSPKVVSTPTGTQVAVQTVKRNEPTMYSAASVGYSAAASTVSKQEVSAGYTESLARFAEAVRSNNPALVGCTPEQGLMVAVMAAAARRAVREKARVVFQKDWLDPASGVTPDLPIA